MPHEVKFEGYLYVADYKDRNDGGEKREDIEEMFKEIMFEDHPEIEVDRIITIEEVKVN